MHLYAAINVNHSALVSIFFLSALLFRNITSILRNKNWAWRYLEKNDIEAANTIRYIDIEMIYRYFRYIEASLVEALHIIV